MPGKIYLVATPIGNLGDFSFRAVEILKMVDLVAAEDTRRSRILLEHYRISKKMLCLREHNETTTAERLVNLAKEGKTIAYLSDAGTPLISDPGQILVKKALSARVTIEAIPGPAAFLQALVLSGLSTEKFKFLGFLPAKKPLKLTALHEVEDETATLIFYEAPHRLLETLKNFKEVFGERKITVCRELTKKFEEVLRGSTSEIISHFQKNPPRGEFVLIVEGATKKKSFSKDTLEKLSEKLFKLKIPEKTIILILKEIFQLPRNQAYQLILKIKKTLAS